MSLNPQTKGPIVLRNDLQPFQWLVRLVTTTGLLYFAYDPDLSTDVEVMNNLRATVSMQDQPKLDNFLLQTRGQTQHRSLAKISYYLCKRKPCPPAMASDYEVIIRLFRDKRFRDEFFTTGQASVLLNREFPNQYQPAEIYKWEMFAGFTSNKQLFEDVERVLLDYWPITV